MVKGHLLEKGFEMLCHRALVYFNNVTTIKISVEFWPSIFLVPFRGMADMIVYYCSRYLGLNISCQNTNHDLTRLTLYAAN